MHNLSAFQRDLLVTVAGMGPISGQDAKNHLEERWGEKINHSRLYPNLDELASMKLIRINKDTGGRHNEYEIMPMGRREMDAYREWEDKHRNREFANEVEDEESSMPSGGNEEEAVAEAN